MKFFKWLKDEIAGNADILFLALFVAFVSVLVFNMLIIGG